VIGGVTHQRYRGASRPHQPHPLAQVLFACILALAAVVAALPPHSAPTLLPLGSEADPSLACVEVHLIRHAQGTHNLAEDEAHAAAAHAASENHAALHADHVTAWVLLEEVSGRAHWDAPLTAEEWRQAATLRREVEGLGLTFDQVREAPIPTP